MIFSVRTYKNTVFSLYLSRVNNCFMLRRVDNGAETETTLLTDCKNEQEAKEYFNGKVSFFCSVVGINQNDMQKG